MNKNDEMIIIINGPWQKGKRLVRLIKKRRIYFLTAFEQCRGTHKSKFSK